jgi:hypothetical protein
MTRRVAYSKKAGELRPFAVMLSGTQALFLAESTGLLHPGCAPKVVGSGIGWGDRKTEAQNSKSSEEQIFHTKLHHLDRARCLASTDRHMGPSGRNDYLSSWHHIYAPCGEAARRPRWRRRPPYSKKAGELRPFAGTLSRTQGLALAEGTGLLHPGRGPKIVRGSIGGANGNAEAQGGQSSEEQVSHIKTPSS